MLQCMLSFILGQNLDLDVFYIILQLELKFYHKYIQTPLRIKSELEL